MKMSYPGAVLAVLTALLFTPSLCFGSDAALRKQSEAARGVVERTLGYKPKNVVLEVTGPAEDGEYFSTQAIGGKLMVRGSSTVAVCRGFYDYVTGHGYGMSTWTVDNITLPKRFPDSKLKVCTTPFEVRQYYNVCTNGYTTPYWGWEEWEKELDRMALHGVNMPLSPIGSEAIFARVWRELGLTEQEIGEFVVGPSHLPWFRMGNMSGLGGPLPQSWYDKTIELEHKLIDRMNELGMTPIFNAFAGFVPKGLKRVFPEAQLLHTGWDDGPYYVNDLLLPDSELFHTIATEYLRQWEAEFGKGKYYLADSFNEMNVPFAAKGTPERFEQIASYGEKVYRSIADANSDAVWVMQGWMFGYQRHIWDPESIRALLSRVPDDKMLILDLSVDFNYGVWENEYTWNYAQGLFGKQWLYSTVPNFGGRTCPVGDLDFYLNGHLQALGSQNKGNLIGYGTAPEGVENNEVIYEILTDASWSQSHQDIRKWLHDYSVNRYGACPAAMDGYWDKMLRTSYGMCSSRTEYRVQRQPYYSLGGRYDVSPTHFEALEDFFACGSELGGSEAYRTDLALNAGFYAFGKAEVLLELIHEAWLEGRFSELDAMEQDYFALLRAADSFFELNPVTRLQRWVELARAWGDTAEQKDAFETDARRLVTVWGPGGLKDGLDDYSCRMWSGLIRDYYIPRWEHWFESLRTGVPFDFDAWEYRFAEQRGVSEPQRVDDLSGEIEAIVEKYKGVQQREGELCGWTSFDMQDGTTRVIRMITPEDYPRVKGIRFRWMRGEDPVTVKLVQINAAGWVRFKKDNLGLVVSKDNPVVEVPVTLKEGEAWQFTYLHILLDDTHAMQDSFVKIEYIF